jgi:PAS domain S-box-containing protein
MFVAWGDNLGFLYNDAYAEILGAKHPGALGRPFQEIWAEIWSDIKPLIDAALNGEATYSENLPLVMNRKGYDEQTWFTFSYSPVHGDDGRVTGMFCAVAETTRQVVAESRLRAAELRFRALVNASSDVVYRMSADWTEMRELDGRDFLADTDAPSIRWLEDYIFPNDRPQVMAAVKAAIQNKGVFELEHRVRRADGSAGWTFSRAVPVLGADGDIVEWFGMASDVTERVSAEAALRASEARYRTLFEAVDAGFCVMEMKFDDNFRAVDYRYAEVNPAFEKQTGVANASGRWIKDLVPDLEQHWFDIYGNVALTGKPQRFENCAEPVGRWYDVHAFRIGEPEQYQVAILFNDITERKNAENQLRTLNETLEEQVAARGAERDRLWNLSQDLLARADYNGMMSAVSPSWTQLLGWTEAELLTRGYATFMHPDDRTRTLWAIDQMSKTHQPARFENRIAAQAGGWKNIEWTVAPEQDGVNFIAVGRDVTATRLHEAELAAAQEALRQSQKMEAMGQLTGGVAHDFNNLLTPIVGALDLLERRGFGGEREQRLIAGAAQSADRAKTLVQRLLAFARRQPLRSVPVDVGQLVQNMADLVASTTGPQIEVVVDIANDLPWAKADVNQLEMALLNLSVNARDAMPNGGKLQIRASAATHRECDLADLRPGKYVRLSVSDTGFGMDAATRKRAVEPFFSTKGVGKGTGLGLSMVHGLASQLDGALTITSAPGQGTNIELWLPQTASVPEIAEITVQEGRRDRRGQALIVDDDEIVRASTAEMLRDLGYNVIEAASADEALRLIANGADLDLVITDHLMPGMSGVDLARIIRHRTPNVPVLIVSGYSEVEGIAADLPRLAKPFRQDELANSIARLFA